MHPFTKQYAFEKLLLIASLLTSVMRKASMRIGVLFYYVHQFYFCNHLTSVRASSDLLPGATTKVFTTMNSVRLKNETMLIFEVK